MALEYAVMALDTTTTDPAQALTAALNAMAANGFELDFIYERLGDPPLAIFYRELNPMYEGE